MGSVSGEPFDGLFTMTLIPSPSFVCGSLGAEGAGRSVVALRAVFSRRFDAVPGSVEGLGGVGAPDPGGGGGVLGRFPPRTITLDCMGGKYQPC